MYSLVVIYFILENLEKTIFGNITSRNFSNSAHNLDTLSLDSSKETSLQSLPMRKPLINYTTKINTAASSKYIFDIVVAIDIGTSFSGFTYCIDNFTKGNTRIVIKVEGIICSSFIFILSLRKNMLYF